MRAERKRKKPNPRGVVTPRFKDDKQKPAAAKNLSVSNRMCWLKYGEKTVEVVFIINKKIRRSKLVIDRVTEREFLMRRHTNKYYGVHTISGNVNTRTSLKF